MNRATFLANLTAIAAALGFSVNVEAEESEGSDAPTILAPPDGYWSPPGAHVRVKAQDHEGDERVWIFQQETGDLTLGPFDHGGTRIDEVQIWGRSVPPFDEMGRATDGGWMHYANFEDVGLPRTMAKGDTITVHLPPKGQLFGLSLY